MSGTGHDGAGTVYLIHLDTPYKHAKHYTGWTKDLDARLEAHRGGRGARLMEVIKDAGITWRLARTWPGTKTLERAIKDRHNAPRLCPKCTPSPQPVTVARPAAQAGTRDHATGPAAQPQRDPVPMVTAPSLVIAQPQPPAVELAEAEMEAG
jgi:predicted GIY-YIG superfamily endonuclease